MLNQKIAFVGYGAMAEAMIGGLLRQKLAAPTEELALMVKETIPEHDLGFRVGLFPIEGENLYCGIFIDITDEEKAKERLHDLRVQTLQRAQEVISRQMQTAQEIARLLGETTAETKVLLYKVMSLFEEEGRP